MNWAVVTTSLSLELFKIVFFQTLGSPPISVTGGGRLVHSTQGRTWKRLNSAIEQIISKNNSVESQSWENFSVVFAFGQTSFATLNLLQQSP